MNGTRSTVTHPGPFRSDLRVQGARFSDDHKSEEQWLRGGRSLTGVSPEFVDDGLGLDWGHRQVQLDVADSGSISSFVVVACIIASVLPKSGETLVTTVLLLQCTWETEDKVVRTAKLRRAN